MQGKVEGSLLVLRVAVINNSLINYRSNRTTQVHMSFVFLKVEKSTLKETSFVSGSQKRTKKYFE